MHPITTTAAFMLSAVFLNVQKQAGLPVDVNAILVQLPLVGLVIWIITARDKMWQEFLKQEREFWAAQNAATKATNERLNEQSHATTTQLGNDFRLLAEAFVKHDERVNTTMQTMVRFMDFKIAEREDTEGPLGQEETKKPRGK